MSCNHPLKAWPIGLTPNGKTQYKITNYSVNHLEKRNGVWYTCNTDFLSSFRDASVLEFVQIPCGKCVGCRLDYAKQWANRLMLELQYHKEAYFVTLTYDDEHVPRAWYADPETGEAMQSMTLCKRDFQLFMKRLRRSQSEFQKDCVVDTSGNSLPVVGDRHGVPFGCSGNNDNVSVSAIRYFASGEYGSETLRPHYHAIIFGLHLDDLVYYKSNELGQPYYTSSYLEDIWSVRDKVSGVLSPLTRLGMVVVAKVTYETCAYTARYTAKKANTQGDDFFEQFNMEPPFCLMSRRSGIGRRYYDEHPDMFDYMSMNIPTEDGGKKVPIPKYFNKLFDVDQPLRSQELKEIRKRMAERKVDIQLASTDLDYESYLQVVEDGLINRTKILKRSGI